MNEPVNPADDDRRFEMSLRLMGNEVIAIALFSSSTNNKWLWMSLGSILTLILIVTVFGADIASFYKSLMPA